MRFPQDPPDARDATLPASRRNELLRLVKAQGQVTVQELSGRFDVSGDTIRRDLDLLAERGLLTRTHGGAVATQPKVGDDTPFAQRLNARKEAKARIGARAARLIADEETLLINGGSTVLAFAAALGERRGLTVVTNNLSLPAVLPPQAVDAVYMLGGEVRQSLQVTLGPVGFAGVNGCAIGTPDHQRRGKRGDLVGLAERQPTTQQVDISAANDVLVPSTCEEYRIKRLVEGTKPPLDDAE